jgi:hypothetical protein
MTLHSTQLVQEFSDTDPCVYKRRYLQQSPDYPTFRFIRRAVSERSILSTVIVRD